MINHTVEVTEEEEKALAWDIADVQAWIENAVYNKARRCVDAICVQAFQDETDTIISAPDKNKIQALLHASGFNILRIESWPLHIKEAAVSFAKIKSAAERLAEWEASLA